LTRGPRIAGSNDPSAPQLGRMTKSRHPKILCQGGARPPISAYDERMTTSGWDRMDGDGQKPWICLRTRQGEEDAMRIRKCCDGKGASAINRYGLRPVHPLEKGAPRRQQASSPRDRMRTRKSDTGGRKSRPAGRKGRIAGIIKRRNSHDYGENFASAGEESPPLGFQVGHTGQTGKRVSGTERLLETYEGLPSIERLRQRGRRGSSSTTKTPTGLKGSLTSPM